MTNTFKIFAAGTSALALSAFGLTAHAQEDGNKVEELQSNKVQTEVEADTDIADAEMEAEMTATKKDWSDKDKKEKSAMNWDEKKMKWNAAAKAALDQCIASSEACNVATTNAEGVLVFPELTSASFVVGGTGGKGVLMVAGEPVGYYSLASGSLGFQAGVEQVSQVMTFNTAEALADLQGDAEWRAGADANITVVERGANAQAIADGDLDSLGEITAISFNQEGLSAGVAIEGIRLAQIETETEDEAWDDDEDMIEDDMEVEMEAEGETSY